MCSSTIGDKIIPHAVSWYTGEAVETEQEGIEEDEEEEEEREGKTWKKVYMEANSEFGLFCSILEPDHCWLITCVCICVCNIYISNN